MDIKTPEKIEISQRAPPADTPFDVQQDRSLTLRFSSDAAFLSLIANNEIQLYGLGNGGFTGMAANFTTTRVQPSGELYELLPGSVPRGLVSIFERESEQMAYLVASSNNTRRELNNLMQRMNKGNSKPHKDKQQANVQIVFDDYNRCMPIPVNTILGTEVTEHHSQEYRVTLAMVDREEGIWLHGTNLSWRGRLTANQRRELHAATQSHAVQDLYRSQQTIEIADALYAQLRCQRNIMAADNTPIESTRTRTESTSDYQRHRYLSAIRYANSRTRKGICKHQTRGCVQVDFELSTSAYVVMFSTTGGAPLPLGCEIPKRRQPGKHQFRLKVPMGEIPNRPTVGFYALAFKDRSAARAVHRELIRGAASCSNDPTPVDEWAASFSRILNQYRDQTEWQALHLNRDANGVMTL